MASEDKKQKPGESVRSLARGLSVIESFSGSKSALTLSEVAKRTNLSRGTARRLLLTLNELGYVATDGKMFALQPRLLTLCHAYLSSVAETDLMMPYMEMMLEGTTHISSSAAVLDEENVVFICGVPAKGLVHASMTVGLRLPTTATSMGRVLLSRQPLEVRNEILDKSAYEPLTPHTITDRAAIAELIEMARRDGYCVSDQEIDETMKSVSVPILSREGDCKAAISITCHNAQRDIKELVEEFLPKLREAAQRISISLPNNPFRNLSTL